MRQDGECGDIADCDIEGQYLGSDKVDNECVTLYIMIHGFRTELADRISPDW